jgi:hypothetical protein
MKTCGPLLWLGAAAGLWMPGASSAATFNVPPPASLSITSGPGGIRITCRSATNFQLLLEGCSDWSAWSLVASNVATNQTMTFFDPQAANRPMRFYRAASLTTPFLYQGTFSGTEQGGFILLARTNATAVFIGLNTTTGHRRGEYAGSLIVSSNDMACGTFIAGVPGCLTLTPSNTLSGRFTNTVSRQTGTVTGGQKANVGIFSGAAGVYTGTVPAPHSGNAKLLLCPDGSFAFYRTDSYTGKNDGAVSSMTTASIVDAYFNGSTLVHLLGSFNRTARTFSLTIHEADELPSPFTMTLNEPLF